MVEGMESTGASQPDASPGRRGFIGRIVAAIAGGMILARLSSALAQAKQAASAPSQAAGTTGPLSTQGTAPWLGEIALVPYNYAPTGWAMCNGQLLSISQNTALFSLLGTTFGGNGTSNFALPDLRGRAPIHAGQGTGLALRDLGEMGGEENHTLATGEMPAHNHTLEADGAVGSSDSPAGAVPAKNGAGIPQYSTHPVTPMNAGGVGLTGGGLPHNNMPPYLVMNYVIALNGAFPPRT